MSEGTDRLMFGDTRLIFLRNANGQPSAGSAIDHLGFSVADLDAAILTWYREKLAGDSGKLKDRLDGLKLSGVWILVQR